METYPVTKSTTWIKYPRHLTWCARRLLHDEITIETRQGLLTMSTRDSGVAAYLYRGRQFDFDFSVDAINLLKHLKLLPSDGGTMLDVGANIGMIGIGLILAKQVRAAIAIEPEPSNFSLLVRNIRQNGVEGAVIPFQLAAGERAEVLTMGTSFDNHGDHRILATDAPLADGLSTNATRPRITVDCQALPEIVHMAKLEYPKLLEPSLLWMDVQGYEGFVMKGAHELLINGLPTIIEVWPYGIASAGMALEEFASLTKRYWSHYWLKEKHRYVKYSTQGIDDLIETLYQTNRQGGKSTTKFENIILVP